MLAYRRTKRVRVGSRTGLDAESVHLTLGKWIFPIVAAAIMAGCYSYVPADFDTVPEGVEISVQLTPAGVGRMAELEDLYGNDVTVRGRMVEGTIVRRDQDALVLYVPVSFRREGPHIIPLNQEVRIRAQEIVELGSRTMDGVRTGVALAAASAALVGLAVMILGTSEASLSRRPPIGNPTEARTPLFLILGGWRVPMN